MNTLTRITGVLASIGILLSVALSPAMAATPDDTVESAVTGGDLTATASAPPTMSGVTLNGTSTKYSIGTSGDWTITDARGSGAGWSLSASATDFISAAGTVDLTPRTLPVGNLTITPGIVTAGEGSDAAPTTSPVEMAKSAQSLVFSAPATSGGSKGTYTLNPEFSLAIPANTYRSNWSAGVDTTKNPYISTITFTLS